MFFVVFPFLLFVSVSFFMQGSEQFVHSSYHTYKELEDVSEH